MTAADRRYPERQAVLAWLLAAVTVLACVAQAMLLALAGVPLFSAEALGQAFPIIDIALVIGATVGAMIITRHPGHRIGWLFCVGQAGAAIGLAVQALSVGVLIHDLPLDKKVGEVAAWLSRLVGASFALALLGLLLLLVPNGRLPSRRWRPVFLLLVAGYAVVVGGLLLISPSSFGQDSGTPPVSPVGTMLELIGQLAVTIGLVGGVIALVVRLRRSVGEERQQLRWIAVAALALGLSLVLYVVDNVLHGGTGSLDWLFSVLFYLGYLAVPVATGFAVLRYRLYDIDLIIGSAVRLAVLGVFVTGGYVALVVGIGGLVGGGSRPPWVSLVAYVLVALGFQPLRRHVGRLADRVVYGERAAPYDSLSAFGRQLAATVPGRELLSSVAHSCVTAFGVRGAQATVLVTGGTDVTQRWPADVEGDTMIEAAVRYDGEPVGGIALILAPGRSLRRGDLALLHRFADRAAPAFQNAALAAALRSRADELARQDAELSAARGRLVSAAVIEREQVAESIRSRVVTPLEDLPASLTVLHERVLTDPAGTAEALIQMQRRTATAIEALRAITAGVLPPLLVRHGLAAAMQTYAVQSPHRPAVTLGEGLTGRRFGLSGETAAYAFGVWAVESLQDHSRLQISCTRGELRVMVCGNTPDDRLPAELPGWQQVVDRVEAIGGHVRQVVPSTLGGSVGTLPVIEVDVVLPDTGAAAQAATSRSGSNSDLSM